MRRILVLPTVFVTVEYTSTQMGKTLAKPIAELTYWAEQNMDNVPLFQKKFDAAANNAIEPL
ncbi:winged helix-turn-helix transcriptional regulator [Pectobacterium sp. B2J-2]|uniref:winged helix-turn-helix transcriptional regulator n=1 Tax=Pectobacterium sp. B2J-2 TaxID=3385372 RepID=UPI0038FC7C6E